MVHRSIASRATRPSPLVALSLTIALTIPLTAARAAPPDAPADTDDARLAGKLDRAMVVRAAVARSPAVRAAGERARATSAAASAEGHLPPPEVMAQVWQVPLARPYAIGDAQMVMVGVQQSFPAPGSLGAREAARGEEARAEEAMARDRARTVAGAAAHAFTDYTEAAARHHVHMAHREVGTRLLRVAEARQAGGGSLADVAQADAELARAEVDLSADGARMVAARARLNALLARPVRAPLGEPIEDEPGVPAWSAEAIAAKARDARPGLRAAKAQEAARAEELRAADREATWPSFTVAGLYFAPVGPMPAHGYGVNASMSLPWLWGAASARREAQRRQVDAARAESVAAGFDVDVEVATADAAARSAARRVQVLRDRALPAIRRVFDAAWSGYESARTELGAVLVARRAVVDAEEQLVMARAALEHALADLDEAAGTEIPRAPLPALSPAEGADHGS